MKPWSAKMNTLVWPLVQDEESPVGVSRSIASDDPNRRSCILSEEVSRHLPATTFV